MFPFLCTPILVIPLLAQRPFKESNAYSKRPSKARALVLFTAPYQPQARKGEALPLRLFAPCGARTLSK